MPLLAVNHHYFGSHGTGRGIFPTTPSALRAQVASLRQHGWRIGTQHDLLGLVTGDLEADERVALITFDDGLKEQLGAVALLETLGVTPLCFVPTAPLVDRVVLHVHKLQMILSRQADEEMVADLDRRFGFLKHEVDEELANIQYLYDPPIRKRVKYFLNFVLDGSQRVEWAHRTFVSLFGDERAAAEALYMDSNDIRLVAAKGLLGSHGHAHLPLATLDQAESCCELERSREILAQITNRAPIGLSYPYGGKSSVSARVYAEAERAGYRYAFTMKRGKNTAATPAMALRRIDTNDLPTHIDGEGVSAW